MKKLMLIVMLFSFILVSGVAKTYGAEIKILFVYTNTAAKAAGSPNQIKQNVNYGLNLLNSTLVNSNIDLTVTAISEYVQIDYQACPTSDAVHQLLTDLGDVNGVFNQIHQLRKEKQADIVCVIFAGYAMGVANLGGDLMVCHYSTFRDSYVFPHEFAHNMGATHEAGMNFNINGTMYRTVENNGGIAIPYFSDDRTIQYTISGTSHTLVIGDATHNNTATIRNSVPAKSILGENLPAVTVNPTAIAATLVDPTTATTPDIPVLYDIISLVVTDIGSGNYKMTLTYDSQDATPFTTNFIDGTSGAQFYNFTTNLDPSTTVYNFEFTGSLYAGDIIRVFIDNVQEAEFIFGTTSINELNLSNLKVYPNPTSGVVNFSNINNSTVQLLDLSGKIINNYEILNNQININDLKSGVYFLKISNGKQEVVKQLIKQ